MRRYAIVAALVLVAGCQSYQHDDAASYVASARQAYIGVVKGVTDMAAAGFVDVKTAEKFELVRVRAAQLLATADAALESGAEFDLSSLKGTMEALQTFIATLIKEVGDGDR